MVRPIVATGILLLGRLQKGDFEESRRRDVGVEPPTFRRRMRAPVSDESVVRYCALLLPGFAGTLR